MDSHTSIKIQDLVVRTDERKFFMQSELTMVADPSDVIVLSDDEENIIDSARRASDQDKQIHEALNNSVLMVSPPSNTVPPPGRPRLDTRQPEIVPSTSEPTRPTGRPRLDTPEKLSSNERVSPKFGSATTLKRLRNDNDDVIVVTPNESVAKKAEEDFEFLKIVKKNKTVTQNTKKVESASQFAELQPYTSHPCSMVPRATAPITKDHRRSFNAEKMLTVNRLRQTPINNATNKTKNVIEDMNSQATWPGTSNWRIPLTRSKILIFTLIVSAMFIPGTNCTTSATEDCMKCTKDGSKMKEIMKASILSFFAVLSPICDLDKVKSDDCHSNRENAREFIIEFLEFMPKSFKDNNSLFCSLLDKCTSRSLAPDLLPSGRPSCQRCEKMSFFILKTLKSFLKLFGSTLSAIFCDSLENSEQIASCNNHWTSLLELTLIYVEKDQLKIDSKNTCKKILNCKE